MDVIVLLWLCLLNMPHMTMQKAEELRTHYQAMPAAPWQLWRLVQSPPTEMVIESNTTVNIKNTKLESGCNDNGTNADEDRASCLTQVAHKLELLQEQAEDLNEKIRQLRKMLDQHEPADGDDDADKVAKCKQSQQKAKQQQSLPASQPNGLHKFNNAPQPGALGFTQVHQLAEKPQPLGKFHGLRVKAPGNLRLTCHDLLMQSPISTQVEIDFDMHDNYDHVRKLLEQSPPYPSIYEMQLYKQALKLLAPVPVLDDSAINAQIARFQKMSNDQLWRLILDATLKVAPQLWAGHPIWLDKRRSPDICLSRLRHLRDLNKKCLLDVLSAALGRSRHEQLAANLQRLLDTRYAIDLLLARLQCNTHIKK